MKILISSGGTKVPIDPVRDITNMSRGTFGAKIATEGLLLGHEIHYFISEHGTTPFSGSYDIFDASPSNVLAKLAKQVDLPRLHYSQSKYKTFDDYQRLLPELIVNFDPDVIFLAAAVSDYVIDNPSDKKVKSGSDLTLQLQPSVKIISQVKDLTKAYLVGFKLLVDSSEGELVQAARQSIAANKCNMVLANDLSKLKSGNHEILAIDDCVKKFSGPDLVMQLMRYILAKVPSYD